MMSRVASVTLFLALVVSCNDPEPDLTESIAIEDFYFISSEGATFRVDSMVFDPAVGGTAQLSSTTIWEFNLVDSSDAVYTYETSVTDSAGTRQPSQLWQFERTASGLTHSYYGLTYLAISRLAELGRPWDPLLFADTDEVISVAGEPIEIHKSWEAVLDSIASYQLPSGDLVDALYLSLASSENLLELRESNEVYGRGLGLLERRLRILDTQQTGSTAPWEEKAERGFTLKMIRQF